MVILVAVTSANSASPGEARHDCVTTRRRLGERFESFNFPHCSTRWLPLCRSVTRPSCGSRSVDADSNGVDHVAKTTKQMSSMLNSGLQQLLTLLGPEYPSGNLSTFYPAQIKGTDPVTK